jgi:sulfite reductase (NADPH) hemoprotein beta-component
VLGPSVSQDEVPDVIEKLIAVYLEQRDSEAERFIDVVRRICIEPFKENVYGAHQGPKARARQLAAA